VIYPSLSVATSHKDDNLRLALEVQKQLVGQGIKVLMTRDSDVYMTLADRAAMAKQADADLLVSLHRNSYIEQTPSTNGVDNYIYLTKYTTLRVGR
jgi:N-acetylmuramoyl-L-alanine amidase